MSVSIQTVEFERREAHLSELEDEPPYTIHGVALGAGDVTVGQSGIKKLWPGEELKAAAKTLEGTNLVEDHNNGSRGVVGQVTKAGYKDGVGVIYEAELFDEDLAENVNNGLLEVSIRGHHIDVDEMEEHEETGAKIVEGIRFDNLSIVPTGAAPSNTLEMGEAEELSVAQLAAFTDELQEDEEFEPEAGEYVQWGDGNHGLVLTMPEDGEVEVDLYEDDDGTWRAVGETEMVSVDSLDEWDVDEEDIGSMDDEEEDNDEEEARDIPDEYFFESEEDAEDFIEGKDGLTGVHEMDGQWMPGADHDEFMEWWDNQSSQSKHDDEEEMMYSSRHDALEAASDLGLDGVHEYEDSWMPGETHEEFTEALAGDVKNRVEGEEESGNEEAIIEQSPERFPDGKTAEEGESTDEGNSSDVESLQAIHEPEWDNAEDKEWNAPDLEDFTDESWEDLDGDERSAIADHFLVSKTGEFPPERFSDLALPVVEPDGTLNLNALANAKARSGQVETVSEEDEERIVNIIDRLANENFEDATFGDDTEENAGKRDAQDGDGLPPGEVVPVHVLTGDDLQHMFGKSEESELDDITTKVTNMTEDIEEQLAELDEPVAVEQSDLEDLQEKADQFEDMNSSLEDLRERTEILDSVDREQVEELADSEEPVVVESTRYEALQDEAEQVKHVYAAALAEAVEVFDAEELTDRFSIEELREKYEENIGDPEEELAAEPRSGDPDEEELEEAAEGGSEELSAEEKEAQEMREQLREKIGGRR